MMLSEIAGPARYAVTSTAVVLLLLHPVGARAQPPYAGPPLGRQIADSASFGSLDGEGGLVFGQITDVKIDAAERIFVLDAHYHEVRVFDPAGALVARFGRGGRGPGEFGYPNSLTISADGEVYVADKMNARVSVLALDDADLVLRREFPVPHVPEAICEGAEGLVLMGLHESMLLHRYSPDGTLQRSFGQTFRTPGIDIATPADAYGKLVCTPDGGVVAVSDHLGIARYYSPRDELVWESELTDFAAMLTTQDGRRIRSDFPEGGADGVTGVVLTGEHVLVQVGRFTPDRPFRQIRAVRTYYLDPVSGRLLETSTSVPKVSALGARRLVGHYEDVYPQVVVYTLDEQ